MPNNISNSEFYNWLNNIKNKDFSKKSVLLIGSGNIANYYADAILKLGISNILVISKSDKKLKEFCKKFDLRGISGRYEKNLPNIETFDLVIIATPMTSLIPTAISSIEHGQKKLLIEKPGAINKKELMDFQKISKNIKVRVAYNRAVYPNLIKLRTILDNEKITSCRFTITERVNEIMELKKDPKILQKWGIANTLHVLSIVCNMIGFPEKISSFASGKLPWHESGSIFVGSGISKKRIPFSYHGDWESKGGWGIEIYTTENVYRIKPLENISYLSKKGIWESIPFECAFSDTKFGIIEEIAIMLSNEKYLEDYLPTVSHAIELIELAETIFHY